MRAMKLLWPVFASFVLATAVACGGGDSENGNGNPNGEGSGGADSGCAPGGCASGQFCDTDRVCKTPEQKCESAAFGCGCLVTNASGGLEVSNNSTAPTEPLLTVVPGSALPLRAVLVARSSREALDGDPIPGARFEWSVANDAGAEIEGLAVQEALGGITQLAVSSDLAISAQGMLQATLVSDSNIGAEAVACKASVVTLAARNPVEGLRVRVVDALTGVGIAGAEVIIDEGANGQDDGGAPVTGDDGTTTTASAPADTFTLTVFAQGYNYVSVVGLASSERELLIPLSSRNDDPATGGFSGLLDWAEYVREIPDAPDPAGIEAAMVFPGFPLGALLNFDLDLFLGPLTSGCSDDPNQQGCYRVSVASLFSAELGLPGGVVAEKLASKETFNVVGIPGRRYAWALGARFGLADLGSLISLLTPFVREQSPWEELNLGVLAGEVFPLMGRIALGAQGNLPLGTARFSEWEEYSRVPLSNRSFDARFPVLDGTERARLSVGTPMNRFKMFDAPTLPPDPELPGQTMEGMALLTGVRVPGFGFVPMGLGLGLDCIEEGCLDRDEGSFDGEIDGMPLCKENGSNCIDGVPASTQNGSVPLFMAAARGRLASANWVTLAAALPITGLIADASVIRASAILVRGDPRTLGADALKQKGYAAQVALPQSMPSRRYTIAQEGALQGHWLTFATSDMDTSSEPTTRWNVYFVSGNGTFQAPAVPNSTWGDPLAPAVAGGDVTAGAVDVTHAALRLVDSQSSLADLVRDNGTTLDNLVDIVDGINIANKDVPVDL